MQIALMRHGKAEDHGSRATDHERELTPQGREKVTAAAAGLVRALLQGDQMQIWSSPKLRARQTAQILADARAGLSVAEYEEIADGDLDGLIRQWRRLPEDTTLLIVGHEPYLSHWGARMAGVILPFRLATAACFSLDDPKTGQGQLRWFAHAKVLAKLGDKGGK